MEEARELGRAASRRLVARSRGPGQLRINIPGQVLGIGAVGARPHELAEPPVGRLDAAGALGREQPGHRDGALKVEPEPGAQRRRHRRVAVGARDHREQPGRQPRVERDRDGQRGELELQRFGDEHRRVGDTLAEAVLAEWIEGLEPTLGRTGGSMDLAGSAVDLEHRRHSAGVETLRLLGVGRALDRGIGEQGEIVVADRRVTGAVGPAHAHLVVGGVQGVIDVVGSPRGQNLEHAASAVDEA